MPALSTSMSVRVCSLAQFFRAGLLRGAGSFAQISVACR